MNLENITAHIDKIETALEELSRNDAGSWTERMKAAGVPYYGTITGALRKRGIAVPEGTGLRWVGDKPTRTLAALIYEEAKEASTSGRKAKKAKTASPAPICEDTLNRAMAIMEKALLHNVADPIAFTVDLMKDARI